ncbi:MAG: acylphosphatase [Methanotrichaceae archaeon]|nr:acylphosphatase [Methanotrichaceae archaeon]
MTALRATKGKKLLHDLLPSGERLYKKRARIELMQRLTAYISGKVQKTGYRARVITIAQNLGLKGYVQNLDNGLVRVVAEGETANLEELLKAIDIKNALINVTDIRKEYSPATCDFDSFFKAVSGGETDQRIDVAAHLLTKLITVNEKILDVITATHEELKETHEELKETHEELKETHEELREEIKGTREEIRGSREDNRSSRDAIVGEIKASSDSLAGEVRESRDAIVGEIGELRVDLKGSIEDRLTRIESDVSQIKEKVGL